MRGDGLADVRPGAVDDVQHAIGQAGFAANLAEQIRGHGRELARFRDGGVSAGDGGRDFPAQQIERQIPRRDQAADAARLAQGVVERHAIGDVRFVFRVQNRGGEEAEIRGRARDIEIARERERLAGIDGFGARELFQVALDQVDDAEKNARAIGGRRARPTGEGFLRGRDRHFHIARIAIGHERIRLPGGGLDVVEILAGDRRHELAADEVLDSICSLATGMMRLTGTRLSSPAASASFQTWNACANVLRPVSIVTVTYDTFFFLRLLVEKVREFIGARAYEIIVVDRGSRDGTLEWCAQQPDVRVFPCPAEAAPTIRMAKRRSAACARRGMRSSRFSIPTRIRSMPAG